MIELFQKVMKDKYGPSAKFSLIASELGDPDAEKDEHLFDSVKAIRDTLLHGKDIRSLPVAETRQLLRKYLRLHLTRQQANGDKVRSESLRRGKPTRRRGAIIISRLITRNSCNLHDRGAFGPEEYRHRLV